MHIMEHIPKCQILPPLYARRRVPDGCNPAGSPSLSKRRGNIRLNVRKGKMEPLAPVSTFPRSVATFPCKLKPIFHMTQTPVAVEGESSCDIWIYTCGDECDTSSSLAMTQGKVSSSELLASSSLEGVSSRSRVHVENTERSCRSDWRSLPRRQL